MVVKPLDYQGSVGRRASYLEMDLAIYSMCSLIRAIGGDERKVVLIESFVGRSRLRPLGELYEAVVIDRKLGKLRALKEKVETDICKR